MLCKAAQMKMRNSFLIDQEKFCMPHDEKPSMEWKGDMETIQPLAERLSRQGKNNMGIGKLLFYLILFIVYYFVSIFKKI